MFYIQTTLMIYTQITYFFRNEFNQTDTPAAGSDHPSAGSHSQELVPPMKASGFFITVTLVFEAISFKDLIKTGR